MPKKFYVTTPIYYPSGKLHIGHAYTTTLADILTRYKQMQGYQTFFLTGSDEHGQKIEKKAKEAGLEPKQYLDGIITNFNELWEKLDIKFDKFIRTTDDYHKETVKKIFSTLVEKDLIYKGFYEGLYCVSCEEFLSPDQIENGICKISNDKPQTVQENTYFLRTSKFQNFIEELLKTDFLIPEYRRTEMLKNFVEPGIQDLSVTRVSFKWGIPINEDPEHIVYVWLDALTNYITALGYLQNDDANFKKFWAEDSEILQLAGKEIVRFHAIYWPIILQALDLRIPNHLLAHGWILNKDTKMSKTLGNVVDPIQYIEQYGADALRFYIAYELPTDRDGNFTNELFVESFNAHLANNVGNLISRVNNMITKYFAGQIQDVQNVDFDLITLGHQTIDKYIELMDQYKISEAMRVVLDLGAAANKFIEVQEPWNLEKLGKTKELEMVMATLQRTLAIIVYLLKPVLVKNYELMTEQVGLTNVEFSFAELKTFKTIKFKKLGDKKIIYQRLK
ncbi:methionine--tRNA ligase [Williamsoniiplasma lucivorax]|uniref:Methionine--tRNA ligase n=1 Tax=Williamsoniiplasma lucivorax TaxID=209274 RepID=A0A2S5RF90_9MOLU|nr:methionine--tRNA ligase [Williamsoniiplasma lucivorax]PPE05984.1 methionyl-tRNA synthetase [Williamsoniiplasma lucivorax]